MNIGIYSGSFNPIHLGHTGLAGYILRHSNLDEVWLMVSPNNPLKEESDLWDEKFRLKLAKIATNHIPGVTASDFEFNLPRPSYTVETLRQLSDRYPQHSFSLIIGSDNMTIFHKWREYEYILGHYPILVYPRKGDDMEYLKKKYPNIHIVENAPLFEISSTMIRQKLKAGESVAEWVDKEVNEILEKEYLRD